MKSKSVVLKEFKQLMSLKYRPTTIGNYMYYVNQFLIFSNNTPLRVTNEDFLNYNITLVKTGVADATRNVAINAVKLYFSLYLNKIIKQNIAIRPKLKKRVVKHIDHDFLIEKINTTKNLKAKLILSLGYSNGLRSSEIINLKRSDINLKEKHIIVNGKGAKQRKLPISDTIINLIINYGTQYRPKVYLFNGRTNKGSFKLQYSSGSILALVKQNIGNYKFHALRHSFAMYLYKQGTPLEQIRTLLGHKKTETTEIYAYAEENMILSVNTPI
jgi:integrase/recombinase XerD